MSAPLQRPRIVDAAFWCWLAAAILLAALGLLLAWVLGLMAQRVGSRSRDDSALLDPAELRRLREQAQARRAGTAADVAPPDGTLP